MKRLRTLLFVPANKSNMLEKALGTAADALLPDLEDSVPVDEKVVARGLLKEFIPAHRDRLIYVRINAPLSGLAYQDLQAVVMAGLSGIVLPKVDSTAEIRQVAAWLDELESLAGVEPGTIEIIVILESAQAIRCAYEIATASPRVASLAFAGAENGDLQNDLACGWSVEGMEMLYARSKLIVDARAAGLRYPLDGVYTDVSNESGLIADVTIGKRLGYKGRPVIHPSHVEIVNRIFEPQPEEIDYCRRLVKAFTAAVSEGRASVKFEGKMVDYAMAAWARNELELAERIGL